MTDTTCHIPVMLDEVLEGITPSAGMIIVDGTLGGGGHAMAIAKRLLPGGRLLAMDLDQQAIERCRPRSKELPVELFAGNFADMPDMLSLAEVDQVDGVLLDLGFSSDQLADQQRGFSFESRGKLDLRFDPERGEPAWELLNHLGESHLADLIYLNGEERYSRRIARRIVEARNTQPVETAEQLSQLVKESVPHARKSRIHPATRTFQALRIAVNEELSSLEKALSVVPDYLKPGGRLAIISFHSLEDRIVKHAVRNDERLEVVTKRPVTPSEREINSNPRARSAKLRVASRV